MQGFQSRNAQSTGLAILIAACVLLPLLGHRPLTSWDEGIYAEVSREMLNRSWLIPHWNFQLWFEKPPLTLWITALFFRLFGVTAFWARAGSAFAGIAIVGFTHHWLLRRRDALTAWLATLLLLAAFGFQHIARVGEMDTLLTLGCCLALAGLTSVSEENRQGWYQFWTGFAIAAMAKGAASVVLLFTLLLVAAINRWRLARFGREFAFGALLFAALVLPWHIALALRFDPIFFREYLGYHVLTRALQPIEQHPTHPWFYLWVLLVSAPPFALLYPSAIHSGWKRSDLRPWAIFSLVVIVFYSAVQTRLPHYIAPAYPALSLLTAVWIADRIKAHTHTLVAAQLPHHHASIRATIRAALILVVAYALGSAVTNSARRGLHVARTGEGAGQSVPEERESIELLRHTPIPATLPPDAPLLLWHEHQGNSIAAQLFYARRPILQIANPTPGPTVPTRYTPQPTRLEDLLTTPQLILADRSLLEHLPPGLLFQPLATGPTQQLGLLRRTP